MLADLEPDRFQEPRARRDHPSPEEDQVRVDRMHHGGSADGQVSGGFRHQPNGQSIALGGASGDRPTVERSGGEAIAERGIGFPLQGLDGPADERIRRGVGFQVAGSSAGTGASSVHLDRHVTTLAAQAVPPFENPAGLDDPAADPGPEREQGQALGISSGPRPIFAESRRVGVIQQDRRSPQEFSEPRSDREPVPERQVGRLDDPPSSGIDRPRRSQTDGENLEPIHAARLDRPIRHARQRFQADFRPEIGAGRLADRGQRPAVVIDHPRLDVRTAQVEPEEAGGSSAVGGHASPRRAGPVGRTLGRPRFYCEALPPVNPTLPERPGGCYDE